MHNNPAKSTLSHLVNHLRVVNVAAKFVTFIDNYLNSSVTLYVYCLFTFYIFSHEVWGECLILLQCFHRLFLFFVFFKDTCVFSNMTNYFFHISSSVWITFLGCCFSISHSPFHKLSVCRAQLKVGGSTQASDADRLHSMTLASVTQTQPSGAGNQSQSPLYGAIILWPIAAHWPL